MGEGPRGMSPSRQTTGHEDATPLVQSRVPSRLDGEVAVLGPSGESNVTKSKPDNVSIGKFDILATYTYAKALLGGHSESEAKERGMVAAIMGAKARLGHAGDHKAEKDAAEKEKRKTITAETFDRQVADKMGRFFGDVFLPSLKRLAEVGLSYEDVKRAVRIPGTWGAKVTASSSGSVSKTCPSGSDDILARWGSVSEYRRAKAISPWVNLLFFIAPSLQPRPIIP